MDLALRIPVRKRGKSLGRKGKMAPKFRWLTIPASDDERSSSTLSSMSPKRSSVSSRSDRETPNIESRDRKMESEQHVATSYQQKHASKSKGHHFEKVGVIDANAQQKIVYAKCLSPKEIENHRSPKSQEQVFRFSPKQNGSPHVSSGSQSKTSYSSPHKRRQSKELTITDMFNAVRKGDIHTLKKFSAAEQSETVDERGNTVLHAAADSGQLQCVQLLARGSCADAVSLLNDDMMTPAALSVKNGHLCCVQWLVQSTKAREELIVSSRQASIDGSNMRPPLAHVAARYDQDVVLDWLCEQMTTENLPIDSADHHSNTAVHEAAAHGRLRCLQTLVSRGASVTVLNSNGDTPGQVADKNGHDLCLGYLVVVETCMSLAQQLITLKMENEEVKKENESLKNQFQNINKLSMLRAQSVEERIKATIQSLSPYAEDNEPGIQGTIEQKEPTPRRPLAPQQKSGVPKEKSADRTVNVTGKQNKIATANTEADKQLPPPPTPPPLPPQQGQVVTASNPIVVDKQSQLFARFTSEPKVPADNKQAKAPAPVHKAKAPNNETESKDKGLTRDLSRTKQTEENSPADTNKVQKSTESTNVRNTAQKPNYNDPVMRGGNHVTVKSNAENLHKNETSVPTITEPLKNGTDDHADNAEIQTLTAGMNGKGATQHAHVKNTKHGPNAGVHGARAWEKMAMDEMLRMARDTRYLPSPTVSMCTEDSTMESREQMRERLAEASRWFLAQQGHGRGSKFQPIIKPALVQPNTKRELLQAHPTVIRNHSPVEAKPNTEKAINSTASWVLGVQKPDQKNKAGTTPFRHSVPQQFVTATNQQYRKIQLDLQKRQETRTSNVLPTKSQTLPANIHLVSVNAGVKSPTSSSTSSLSSTTINSPNRLELSSSSSASTRPTSAKSSCSNASTVRSNNMNSSSSSISNSTAASQDTVVENGMDSARWRSNAELVDRQYNDPLQKRRTPIASESPSSLKTHRSTSSNRSTSSRINDVISGHDAGILKPYEENPMTVNETAEIRVNLPPRNNSFLRKVQPSGQGMPSHIDVAPRAPENTTPTSRQLHVVTYPSMSLKSPSPGGKGSTRVAQGHPHVTSSVAKRSVKFSTADDMPLHKVEIVSPGGRIPEKRIDMSGRKPAAVTGRNYVMWKPSSAQVTKHESEPAPTAAEPTPPVAVEKGKKNKNQGSSSAKLPYGGMFSTTNSPKTNTKRKGTRLFHF